MANVQLIGKVLDAIAAEPERWDQRSWVDSEMEPCKTTMCFAGHALIQSGEYILGEKKSVYTAYDPWDNRVNNEVLSVTDFYDKGRRKFLDDILKEQMADGKVDASATVAKTAERLLDIPSSVATIIFNTVGGEYTRNPDAFRMWVIRVLLINEVIDTSEAMSLLDVETSWHYEPENDDEPPF